MGLIQIELTISNPRVRDSEMAVESFVDTGALHLCLPGRIADHLQLHTLQRRDVELADGTLRNCPYVGPVELSFGDRSCYTGAVLLGNRVLLGVLPMVDLDLSISLVTRSVEANPASLRCPLSMAKGFTVLPASQNQVDAKNASEVA